MKTIESRSHTNIPASKSGRFEGSDPSLRLNDPSLFTGKYRICSELAAPPESGSSSTAPRQSFCQLERGDLCPLKRGALRDFSVEESRILP